MTSTPEPNAEAVNDRVKLLFHRLIARRLKEDPSLIESARKELEFMRERFGDPDFIGEWQELLDQGVDVVRREIVRRTERMIRLRISSPLGKVMDLSDEAFRRRVWRSSREALTRRLDKAQSSGVFPVEIIDGVNDFASEDPRSPTSIVRAADVETLIAILEDEYSLPNRAAGPLSTSLEWAEIKRRLTGIDPLEEDISEETSVAAMREARDGKLENVTLEELRAMLHRED